MAGSKEIRTKIKSVENTRKITRAMEMVAAAKMRKSQQRMRAALPYAAKIRQVAAHLSHANSEYKHPYLVKRDAIKNVGIILITSDKGLCGGLNTNVIETMIGTVKVMLDAYVAGEVDAIYISYNHFVNTMKQEPVFEQLLPLSDANLSTEKTASWDYIYEPDAQAVIDEMLLRYVESLVYTAVSENQAAEQSARMVAMKAASDNAKAVIGELKLIYNKARQAAITKEISEIVGGAAAVS